MNAINAYNRLNANVAGLKKASEKLASGYRINRAGDDAAGLAISEKMRSQIRGLNQAVRNSQDGINMIQTFEGAAQETHNILQRMKELATESANGTYDNATDRAAIELEFQQLNDELNQIADTDFNGTIVLNGGEMSDGLKATMGDNGIGEFDYAAAKAAAEAGANTEPKDIVGGVKVSEGDDMEAAHKILDNTKYDLDAAKALWEELGIDAKDYDEVNITFVRDADGKWSGAVVTDKDGNIIKGANAAVEVVDNGNGGFTVKSAGTNAVFNNYDPNAGDYITLTFTNVSDPTVAPQNGALDEDVELNFTPTTDTTLTEDDVKITQPTFELAEFSDDEMTQEIVDALDKVNNAKFTATVEDDGAGKAKVTYSADDSDITVEDDGTVKVGDIVVGKISGAEIAPAAAEKVQSFTQLATGVWTDGTKQTVSADDIQDLTPSDVTGNAQTGDHITVAGNKITGGTWAGGAAPSGGAALSCAWDDGEYYFDGKDWYVVTDEAGVYAATGVVDGSGDENDLAIENAGVGDTIDVKTSAGDFVEGTFDFGINIDYYAFADGDVEAHAVETKLSDEAMEAVKSASQAATGVTKADAFENSTARLTYAEHIILQTGSRTKDAVDFTFAYNQDGSADMGDLKANLNLSARADGLNTANLTLANQKDANYAIDQIDKAINKVSMVRATFGAIQNRLEHKITNLTTTAENLTEAESSIRDTDMAQEMMNYTKFNILQQAAQSMLAQANQQPQSILQLLG